MSEVKQQVPRSTETRVSEAVHFYARGELVSLGGRWDWDLHTEAVFCSDVMLTWPADLTGTKSIVHPDDLAVLTEAINKEKFHISFRIITTYGEIKEIRGSDISRIDTDPLMLQQLEQFSLSEVESRWYKHHTELLALQKEMHDEAEWFGCTGSWYLNTDSFECYYSDGVFRLHRLLPQSLNAHANTFQQFIHPEDAPVVTEALERAYAKKLPLQLEYRIITNVGDVLLVRHNTRWKYNYKGENILFGAYTDITQQKKAEEALTDMQTRLSIEAFKLQNAEALSVSGSFEFNITTRKVSFSPGIHRLLGIKSATMLTLPMLLKYVHPDDRGMFEEAIKRDIKEHSVSELQFRIVRADGKVRNMLRKGQLFITPDGDPLIVGNWQDITDVQTITKQVEKTNEKLELQNFLYTRAEEMSSIGSWLWDIETGKISLSQNGYRLLHIKAVEEVTRDHLEQNIHAEDKKTFARYVDLMLKKGEDAEFAFRVLQKQQVRFMQASFRSTQKHGKQVFVGSIRDVTENHQLKDSLMERMAFIETLMENLPDQLMVTDVHHNLVIVNKALEKVQGLRRDEVLHKNLFDVFPALKRQDVLVLLAEALSGKKVQLFNQASLLKRGFINVHLAPIYGAEGEVVGVLHYLHDITKEYQLTRQLSQRLAFIERMIEATVDRIVVLDKNMNYQYWNTRAEEYYGLQKEQVIGKNILEVFPQFRNEVSYEQFRRVLRGETVHLQAVEGDKDTEYTETYLIPIKEENEEVVSVLWIVHDLSRERQLQAERRKAAELLQATLDSAPNMIQVFEAVRDDNGFIIDFKWLLNNHAAETIYGDVIGKSLLENNPGVVEEGIFETFKRVVETGIPDQSERHYVHEQFDGWFYQSVVRLNDGVVTTTSDITAIKDAGLDLTRRKETEDQLKDFALTLEQQVQLRTEELAKNLAILKHAEDLANIGSWEYDRATGTFNWSEGMYRLFGLSHGIEVTPETYLDFVVEEDQPVARRIVKSLRKQHQSFEETLRIRKEGRERTLRLKASVVRGETGKTQKIIGVVIDLTDLTAAEERFRETKYWLESTAQASPDAITVYDLQHKQPVFLNNCLAEWLQRSADELVAMGIEGRLELIHPDDRLKLLQFNERVVQADGATLSLEYRLSTKDGRTLWINNRCRAFKKDAAGRVTHLLSFLQDVTEEVQLREQLTQRTQFLQALLDSVTDRIIVINTEYQLVTWNKRTAEMYQLNSDEVARPSFFELFPKLKADAVITDALHRSLQGQQVHLPVRKEVYSDIYSEIFFIPLQKEEGQVYGVLIILHDVTRAFEARQELKKINASLEAKNRQLESKNDEIANFAFVASHDLKEPLRKLNTYASWVLDEEEDNLSARGKENIRKIIKAVKRMNLLIEDILVLTRIHADQNKSEAVNLNGTLDSVLNVMADAIRNAGAEIDAEELPIITGNSNQLFYLFKNLLSNAIKFRKPSEPPRIQIRAEILNAAALSKWQPTHHQYAKVSIKDNGTGFDMRYAGKLFQVFQRLHHNEEGTGVGLPICKKIMENHNGFIVADSRLGEGSEFSCYFPL